MTMPLKMIFAQTPPECSGSSNVVVLSVTITQRNSYGLPLEERQPVILQIILFNILMSLLKKVGHTFLKGKKRVGHSNVYPFNDKGDWESTDHFSSNAFIIFVL